ncbi:cytochrome b [Kordiimonas aquimaris]|uniref:cytochrome b n=1 Tax=Kordiimonas aquimaris TaxID=707591 RepID=UPI0021D2E74C|nr:cytochrome b/b6 domain-containing protein [Kordiimonas aquimaris]
MAISNTESEYGWLAKAMHWIMAVLLIGLVAFGLYMSDMPRGDEKSALIRLHASAGVLAVLLLAVRFGWRMFNTAPRAFSENKTQARLAHIVHMGFYVFVATQVITGSMSLMTVGWDVPFFDLFSIPTPFERDIPRHQFWEGLHVASWYMLAVLFLLHIGGVVYHQIVKKRSVLKRML